VSLKIPKIMHHIVFIRTKKAFHVASFHVVNFDKVMMIDNQSWVNIHLALCIASSTLEFC
jgi:hypothetical protein